ncbi:D-glucuronyl C5-epimerase family protein [Sporanaerobacter acetigenes]|uniref:D-glucuronyl C5-epimerase family protein n=1 Tax=Sporanaerobacter acetigenes TaxID=165813 RepID=UPI003330654E
MKSLKLMKRWLNMLTGKSVFHVKQGVGKYYSLNDIKGYYNDLTNKVCGDTMLDDNGIPINITISNIKTYFPITIFQYGLGLYDLYLETSKENYIESFMCIVEWAMEHIETNGMWKCMECVHDTAHDTQSAMCQSEGASVLLRAYVYTKEKKYFDKAKLAIDFMLQDTNKGGCTNVVNERLFLQEYVSDANLSVLNGWIFSIFGLLDLTLVLDDETYKNALSNTLDALCDSLEEYDRGFWSSYDLKGTIASPAYHDLHIMQLELLYTIFKNDNLKVYSEKWRKYQNNKCYKTIAMLVKLKQKVLPSKYYDINTSLVK